MLLAAALVAGLLTQSAQHDSVPLYPDLGDHHHSISTTSSLAQRYFDQGLRLVFAFNHAEAIRSFRQAQRLDPRCAMCYWGEALALGPNINVAMDSASAAAAYAAIRRAMTILSGGNERERAYIRALAVRYAKDPAANRAAVDSAYATAMGELARRYPSDDDAAVLHAESRMVLGPWNYWTAEKRPKPHGAAALGALEPVIARSPDHAGACHFFIHAVEAAFPERAIPCAERLPRLMPGAGHVVHMPAHIYIRVGRYADAIDRNVHALHADEAVLGDMAPDGVYRLALHPHNGHFLSYAASMIGRSAQALESARLTRGKVDSSRLRAPGLGALQHYYMLPTFTMVRFARWDAILAEPALPEDLPYPRAIRHYARALAYAAKRDVARAEGELDALTELRKDKRLESVTIWDLNPSTAMLDIAIAVTRGEIAGARGDHESATVHFARAVEIEDGLTYDEPPPWYQPARQQLARALLSAKRYAEAEREFRRDLERHPENGWSLHGLAQALEARGARAEAEPVRARFDRAWKTADVVLDPQGTPRALAWRDAQLATGVRIRYVEAGDQRAIPIILLHGISDSWFSFSRVIDSLATRARVIAIDQRGHGGSERPADGYTPRAMAADVLALMDSLRLDRAVVLGHSMGSIVAQHLAAAAPNRVSRLVLVNSAASSSNAVMRELQSAITSFDKEVPYEFVREFQHGSVSLPVPDEFMTAAIAESRRLPLRVWRATVDWLASPESAAPLARITAPTLVLWGEKDAVFSRADQDALRAAMPNATFIVYPTIGHTPHWEQPETFVRDVVEFIDRDVAITK